jgi:FkbM family methyltransferase
VKKRNVEGLIADVHARAFWLKQRLLRRERTRECLTDVVQKGSVVVDVGAHRGLYTIWFAHRVGGTGEVHAFEPNPAFHPRLAVIDSHFGQVAFHPTGLWSRAGVMELYVPHLRDGPVSSLGRLSLEGQFKDLRHDVIEVTTERLDDISFERPPRLLKIDVEGQELEVLRGAVRLLQEAAPVVLVEVEQRHRDGDVQEVFDFLTGLGYEGSFVRAGSLHPIDSFDVERDQLRLVSSDPTEVPFGEYVCDFVFSPHPAQTAS